MWTNKLLPNECIITERVCLTFYVSSPFSSLIPKWTALLLVCKACERILSLLRVNLSHFIVSLFISSTDCLAWKVIGAHHHHEYRYPIDYFFNTFEGIDFSRKWKVVLSHPLFLVKRHFHCIDVTFRQEHRVFDTISFYLDIT